MSEDKNGSSQSAVPEGWKLVPVEPTKEMNRAGFDAHRATGLTGEIWRAMLAASPTQPASAPAREVAQAWEYSFWHSSAIGHGDKKVGPCLTYDKAQAFGVGCVEQRGVLVRALATPAAPAQPREALTGARMRAMFDEMTPLSEMESEEQVASWWKHYAGKVRLALTSTPPAPRAPSIEESATFTPWDSLPWKPKPIGFAQRSDIDLYAKVLTIRPPDAKHDVALFTRDQLQRAVSAALKEFEGMHWVDLDKALAAPASAGVEEFPLPDVDALAQFIRKVDGTHHMGAGALAEKIIEWWSGYSASLGLQARTEGKQA